MRNTFTEVRDAIKKLNWTRPWHGRAGQDNITANIVKNVGEPIVETRSFSTDALLHREESPAAGNMHSHPS